MTLYESILKYENEGLNALYFENKSITYKQLLINIRKMITYLKGKGIKKGDIVTVVLPNIPSTVYLFYALDALGVIQNIVHPLTPAPQIIKTMEEVGSKNAIVLALEYQNYKELFDSSNYNFFFVNPMHDKSFLMRHAFYLKFKKVKENNHLFLLDKFHSCKEETNIISRDIEEPSIYLHSGGTTGTPKVIEISDRAINNLAMKVDGIVNQSIKGKSMLAVLPTFHGFGLGMGIHAPLANGASSSLMIKFNADKVIEWINQNKVNLIIGVPQLYQKLMKNPNFSSSKLSNLEFSFIGGDNVPPSLIKQFNELMKANNSSCMLLEGYGLTETVTVCNVNTKLDFKVGSVGKPLRGIEIQIRENDLNLLPNNEIGEVYISGNTTMNGYLNDIETTNKTLINLDNKLWVKTGDLGYLDNDGFLFLKGRMKRMFKISGINVYPSEVEKIATDLVDYVKDASLEYFDDGKPHMVLFLIKNKQSNKNDNEIIELVTNELNQKLLKYSLPKKIFILDEFPQTRVGKIDHSKFKDIYHNEGV